MYIWQHIKNSLRSLRWMLSPEGLKQHLHAIEEELWRTRGMQEQMQFVFEHARSWADVFGQKMLLNPHDSVVSPRLALTGSFEPFETEVIERHIRTGDTIIDIGANIGYYTLLFARRVGPQGRVIAFEPDPTNFDILRRNVRMHGYQNVTLVNKAVADTTRTMLLYQAQENKGDHRIYPAEEGRASIPIEAVALDDFFPADAGRVDFIKMDIQGAEGAALQGMKRLLARNHGVRLVTEFWPRGMHLFGLDAQQFIDELRALGFEITDIDEHARRLEPADIPALLRKLPIEAEHDLFFTNLLCMRTQQQVGTMAA